MLHYVRFKLRLCRKVNLQKFATYSLTFLADFPGIQTTDLKLSILELREVSGGDEASASAAVFLFPLWRTSASSVSLLKKTKKFFVA